MMLEIDGLDVSALQSQKDDLLRRYEGYQQAGLALDMTRGKPCPQQLDLSLGMLTNLTVQDYRASDRTDCRNYGGLDGLPEAKTLFAQFLEVAADEILIAGNSSLWLMYETIAHANSHGVPGGTGPWRAEAAKFLCPVPGYDRHFSICEHQSIEMLTVQMDERGPDMDQVERLAGGDPRVKGIWIVPKYGNPTGVTLSAETVQRLARLKAAAPDFRIMWDNAYAVHHLGDSEPQLTNILESCKAAGYPDRPLLFGSTSKISFAGAGLAVMGGSTANLDWMRGHLSMMTIGPDKLNQLRHVKFFENMDGIRQHMKKHAAIIRPKFEAVDEVLQQELGGAGVGSWNKPTGGYFISFDTLPGCAARVVALAKAAGVKLTAAGATYPYGKDPVDQNIRLAPTLPSLQEIKTAMGVFGVCVKLATLEKLSQ